MNSSFLFFYYVFNKSKYYECLNNVFGFLNSVFLCADFNIFMDAGSQSIADHMHHANTLNKICAIFSQIERLTHWQDLPRGF